LGLDGASEKGFLPNGEKLFFGASKRVLSFSFFLSVPFWVSSLFTSCSLRNFAYKSSEDGDVPLPDSDEDVVEDGRYTPSLLLETPNGLGGPLLKGDGVLGDGSEMLPFSLIGDDGTFDRTGDVNGFDLSVVGEDAPNGVRVCLAGLSVVDCLEDWDVGGMAVDDPNDVDNGFDGKPLGFEAPLNGENVCFSVCLYRVGSSGRTLDCGGPPRNGLKGCLGSGELSTKGFAADDCDP
jgi:hypothetical protein